MQMAKRLWQRPVGSFEAVGEHMAGGQSLDEILALDRISTLHKELRHSEIGLSGGAGLGDRYARNLLQDRPGPFYRGWSTTFGVHDVDAVTGLGQVGSSALRRQDGGGAEPCGDDDLDTRNHGEHER